jgi:outer membrane receptor protein involved in Fe transport
MNVFTRAISILPTLLLAITALTTHPAAADQQTAPQGGGAADQTTAGPLQEVVVTATRHEESLSKVPISVTALTQADMDIRGLKDFQDIVRFTPGVSIDSTGTNNISIRGISSSAGAGTTGIYIDDTPIQMRDVGFNPDDALPKTFDLARVEVLRGPQGTLFGSGSEGGTVRYILTEPSLTNSSTYGRAEVSYTEYGQPSYELGIAHGQPIVDGTFGFRASAWYRYDGGWINRVDPTTGAQVQANANYQNTAMFRLAAIWAPASSFTITPSIIYQDSKKHNESTFWPAYSSPGQGQFNTATPELIPVDDQWYLPALKMQWDLGKSVIISDTSYYHRKEFTGYQGTVYDLGYFQLLGWPNNPLTAGTLSCTAAATPPPCPWYPLIDGNGIHLPAGFGNFQTPNQTTNTQKSYVQELRWQSNDESSRWRWTVGLFWQEAKEGSIEELKDPNNQINPFFTYLYGVPATSVFGNFYSCPDSSAYPYIPACDIYYLNNQTIDKQFAGFGEVTYAFNEHWRLTVGERVAHTTFNISSYSDGLENYGPILPGQPLVPRTGSSSETPNTPKASLAYQMNPGNLFYATYSKGFRVGGGNPPLPSYCNTDLQLETGLTSAPATYGSDSTQNYEVGSKNTIGNNMRIATSVYYIKWNNIQQSIYVAGSCGLQFIDNVGTAVSKGFDLQGEWALEPLFLDVAVGYTDARFTKDSPLVNSSGVPLVRNGNAISGQAVINGAPGTIPPWDIAVGAEYRFHPWQHEAFVRVDWTYQSKNPWLAAIQDPKSAQFVPGQVPAVYTPAATSFTSLRAGVHLGDWQLSAFVDNVFDSHTVLNYQLSQFDSYNYALSGAAPTVQQNQYTYRPRTVGINATWRIGH